MYSFELILSIMRKENESYKRYTLCENYIDGNLSSIVKVDHGNYLDNSINEDKVRLLFITSFQEIKYILEDDFQENIIIPLQERIEPVLNILIEDVRSSTPENSDVRATAIVSRENETEEVCHSVFIK